MKNNRNVNGNGNKYKNGNGTKMKKFGWTKRVKALVISFGLALAVAVGGAGAAIGLSSNNNRLGSDLADPSNAVSSTTINLGSDAINTSDRTAVQDLLNYVAGSTSNVNYFTLNTQAESWKGTGSLSSTVTKTKTADQFTAKTITFGGVVWNVVYVSKADYTANGAEKGDIIVTLYQANADTNYTSKYSPTASGNSVKYPSANYGASLVRSTLVGSQYSANNTTLTTGTQNAHWRPFTSGALSPYIATPASMAWQEVQPTFGGAIGAYPNHFPNDSWAPTKFPTTVVGSVPDGSSTKGWYSAELQYWTKDATVYSAWKDDKLWLPSLTETGWSHNQNVNYNNGGSGIWNLNPTQQNCGTSASAPYAWIRSAQHSTPGNTVSWLHYNDGNDNRTTSDTSVVRPALHLNLKSVVKAAGLYEQNITYHAAYGTAPANTKYAVGTTGSLSAPTNVPSDLIFLGWAKGSYTGSTVITTVSGQTDALDLYAVYRPTNPTVTVGNTGVNICYGENGAFTGAGITHPLIDSGQFTLSTYWRQSGSATNLVTDSVMTVTNGANPKLEFTRPPKSATGTYSLYYTLTPTTAEAAKGLRAFSNQKVGDYALNVAGARLEVKDGALPTLTGGTVYVGQEIAGRQLTGGQVWCAVTGETDIAGTWKISSTGLFKKGEKIKARFVPDDSVNYTGIEDLEIDPQSVQLTFAVSESVDGVINDPTAHAARNIELDYGSNVAYTISEANKKLSLTFTRAGVATTEEYDILAPDGYTPFLYATNDGNREEIASGAEILANVTSSDRAYTVGYTARGDTPYKIYYVQQPETGAYPALAEGQTWDELAALNPRVFVYEGSDGVTGANIRLMNGEGQPFVSGIFTERTLDNSATDPTPVMITGDGAAYAVVYLKLNEYTVVYSSKGANPASQSKTFRYGAAVTEPDTVQPVKPLSDFKIWTKDEAGTEAVAFNSDKVLSNMTVYAQYDIKQYYVHFDFNVGDGEGQLPDSGSDMLTANDGNLYNGKVQWDVASLFDGFAFASEGDDGFYKINYNVDNLKTNKRINGVKPTAVGYTFNGWYAVTKNADGTETVATTASSVIRVPNSTTATDIYLRANWRRAQYTVRFDEQNGNRITSKRIDNITTWDSVLGERALGGKDEPTRTGYQFLGWFVDNDEESDNFLTVREFSRFDIAGVKVFSASDFIDRNIIGRGDTAVTIYAVWESLPVYILTDEYDEYDPDCKGALSFSIGENELGDYPEVSIGDVVTVKIEPKRGYVFKNLVITLPNGTNESLRDGVTSFTVANRIVKYDSVSGEYSVTINAEYNERRYSIEYNTDGGRAADSTFARSYSASELVSGNSVRAVLPKQLTKNGYDFAGWIFEETEDTEQEIFAHENDLTAENLYLVLDEDEFGAIYRNIKLKAKWTAQEATVYLYNVSYNGVYNETDDKTGYYIDLYEDEGSSTGATPIVTDRIIEIVNPTSGSFDFVGWATSRGGSVVYPAVEGKTTVTYRVNADHDVAGNPLNKNRLYAVWHIKGVNYIRMTAENNGAQFSTAAGAGVKISAKPAQEYSSSDGSNIKLNYYWYRVNDGMYNECFTFTDYVDKEKGMYLIVDNNESVIAYESVANPGTYFNDADGQLPFVGIPDGKRFQVKDFNSSSVGTACVLKVSSTGVSPDVTPTVTITQVENSGTYICVVDVVAQDGAGTPSRAEGYGEIEITIEKAVYDGLSMADRTVEYNASSRAGDVFIEGLEVVTDASGLKTITLPDKMEGANARPGSKVIVTYRYYRGAGELVEGIEREEITDLNLIKNVGEYHVVASFAFAVGGDNGNYEPLADIEADLIITEKVLSDFNFKFTHGTEEAGGDFEGVYDGTGYGVNVVINDTVDMSVGSPLVTAVDDVAAEIKVYSVTDDGDIEITAEDLPTVDAGAYAVVIVGLSGADKDNYALGEVKLRQEYVINKQTYEVASHIHFNDVDNAVFNNTEQTIEISFDEGYALPETVTPVYRCEYEPADIDFNETNSCRNGGRYAGVYVVTVTFEDTASNNYETLESMTATLTINKAGFFDYFNNNGVDLLRDYGFENATSSYQVGKKYDPYVKNNFGKGENLSLTYVYYRIDEATQERIEIGRGTHEDLVAAGDLISLAGRYEIVALINFETALYRNNFKDVEESETTITYVIDSRQVESVSVVSWKDGFNREALLGGAFDYGWIEQIDVVYEQGAGTLHVTDPAQIELATIKFELNGSEETNKFWHVGQFDIIVSYYGRDSAAYTFTVKEAVTGFTLKYSEGAGYNDIPEGGLELGGVYSFIIEYSCTDDKGVVGTKQSDAVIAESGLVIGKNVLTVTEDYYTFGEISVDMFEVLTGVSWMYSADGEKWTTVPSDGNVVYIGKEYLIKAVYNGMEFAASSDNGAPVNVDSYLLGVGRSGDYRIDEECLIHIVPKTLAFEWDSNVFVYDALRHVPSIVSSGLEEIDEGLVTFSFNYFDRNQQPILSSGTIITVGQYYVSVSVGGDATARKNYTLEGAQNAEMFAFEIVRATINANVYYSESNYGNNITYMGNGELRLDAMKADFGGSETVKGQFKFVKPVDDGYEDITGKDFAEELGRSGSLTVNYVYIPENKNYNNLYSSIELQVLEPVAKTGRGALSVEFGEGAIRFYLVDQTLDLTGIEVYQLYESTYVEDGVWYGAKTRIENPVFRLEGYQGSVQNYVITANDLSGNGITLIAHATTGNTASSGTLDIPVINKLPKAIEITNANEIRKVYYVGETPTFADVKFRALFDDEDDTVVEDLTVGTVQCAYNGGELTTTGNITVKFWYYSENTYVELEIEVRDTEDLVVQEPENKVLIYDNGNEIPTPEISFIVDGRPVGQNELDGVTVNVKVTKDGRGAIISAMGEYEIVYTITVDNPRFNKIPEPITVIVEVTETPYSVTLTRPVDGLEVTYDGNPHEIPKPVIGDVADLLNGGTVDGSKVTVKYRVYRGNPDTPESAVLKTVADYGEYTVEVNVYVAGYSKDGKDISIGSTSYKFRINTAENAITEFDVPEFVIFEQETLYEFDVKATFGASTVKYTYSRNNNSGFTATRPDGLGTWYVKATIAAPDNKNYTEASVVKTLDVRSEEKIAGDNKVSGGDGVGADWTLEINPDDVSEVSLNQHEILGGYEVLLKDGDGVVQKDSNDPYTVRIKLSDELAGKKNMKVFIYDENANTATAVQGVKVDADGYLEFQTKSFGRFVLSEEIPVDKGPMILLIVVIVLGVVAAAGIAACVVVFLKKRKGGNK